MADANEVPIEAPADASALIELIRRSVIGDDEAADGPFGPRRVTYADYTASGRSLTFIEDYLRAAVLPRYANTHTESSGTGLQTSRFREEARQIIANAVGADAERDVVIFAGSGSTGAIHKLVDVLGLRLPAELDERYGLRDRIPAAERPVVFIGPYEHHSNELPWRESIADVVTIHEDADGRIDLAQLEAELVRYADRPLRIGSFSAASNVTGILSDTRAVSVLLHRHGALSLWDFAAAAPYVAIEMAPHRAAPGGDTSESHLDEKDAVFISVHKLIGGPGTPGVLVARRDLFRNRVPTVVGGGTVAYVNTQEHVYLTDPEHREEAGTPDIIGSIRAGLAFQLKEQVGEAAIAVREGSFIRRAIERWEGVPGIDILGDHAARRLSIVSFTVRHAGRYLHHNLVVALLNDLFGIQSRGGCSCAGPYGHRLLGIDLATSHALRARDPARLRGHQARLGPGQLQLLHQRDRVRLHPRCRRAHRHARLAAAAAVPPGADERSVAPRRRHPDAATVAGGYPLHRGRRCATTRAAGPCRSRPWHSTSRRRARSSPRHRCPRLAPSRPMTWAWTSSSTTCAGS